MADHKDLEDLMTDIADSIREQTGTTEKITADDFPEKIRSIKAGSDVDLSAYAPLDSPIFKNSITLGDVGGNGVVGKNSMFIGKNNIGEGANSLAIGADNKLAGDNNFIIGGNNETAATQYSVCIGEWNKSSGSHCVAMGRLAIAEGEVTMAIGNDVATTGTYTLAVNYGSRANGKYSTAMNSYTTTNGDGCLSTGANTIANGDNSFTGGYGTISSMKNSMIIGHRNIVTENTQANESNHYGDAFVIGNGVSDDSKSNAFRVAFNGSTYGLSSFNSTGADYAEYFEWSDGNPNDEDRVGYFVTLKNNKISKAEDGDYVLGVVSGQPCIIGNADENWQNRYMRDDYGRYILVRKNDDDVYMENPSYDPTQKYVERKDRKEWSAVGMVGVLSVRDDGSCVANGYCKVGSNGIGTYTADRTSDSFRVIERVSNNVVKVVIK